FAMDVPIYDPFFEAKQQAIGALSQVMDPELFVNIIDLGLVYDLDFQKPDEIRVTMTLSTRHCPLGDTIQNGVRNALHIAFPDRNVAINLVWEPEWNFDSLTEEGRR